VINNAAEYALKARLSHWFENEDIARIEYNSLTPGIDKCTECNVCSERCPYDIDVPRKLKIVKSKLETGYVK
jgi:Fe-S oxidoreductase